MAQITEKSGPTTADPEAYEVLDRAVVLFSGQGSQAAGMGRDVAESDPDAMQLWKQAEAVSGLPLRAIYWEGNEPEMSDTRALQPALTVTNYNIWRKQNAKGNIKPLAFAGHSLGEFGAMAAAGVLSPQSAIELTSLRGKLMAEADPAGDGAMAAILKLRENEVMEILKEAGEESGESIIAANYNTPEQIVVSGTKRAVELAANKTKKRKGRSVLLKVSGAFHSPLMKEANELLKPLIEKLQWRDPAFPVYCNLDGKAANSGAEAKKKILQQMVSPVQWVSLVRNLYLTGARLWLEISPRAVLGKMIGPSLAGIAGQCDSLRVELINSLASII